MREIKSDKKRDDLISEGSLHCTPRQVRPLQVDWSDLARSIIYIAPRRVCERLGLAVSFRIRIVSTRRRGARRNLPRRGVRHSFNRPIDAPARARGYLEVVSPANRYISFPDLHRRFCGAGYRRLCIRGRAFKSPSGGVTTYTEKKSMYF